MTEITNENLLLERSHKMSKDADKVSEITGESIEKYQGVQRIYKLENGYGLSVVNPPALHSYPFAWEVAVLKLLNTDPEEIEFELTYDTPLTDDVEVFSNTPDTNEFIHKAAIWASQQEA